MDRQVTKRATEFWKRLVGNWGARFGDQFGDFPPQDWAALIDQTDDRRLDAALRTLRRINQAHPPTLGEFEAAIPKPPRPGERSAAERLNEYVTRQLWPDLCAHQRMNGRAYIGDPIMGLELFACGICGRPAIRVNISDLEARAA